MLNRESCLRGAVGLLTCHSAWHSSRSPGFPGWSFYLCSVEEDVGLSVRPSVQVKSPWLPSICSPPGEASVTAGPTQHLPRSLVGRRTCAREVGTCVQKAEVPPTHCRNKGEEWICLFVALLICLETWLSTDPLQSFFYTTWMLTRSHCSGVILLNELSVSRNKRPRFFWSYHHKEWKTEGVRDIFILDIIK